MKLGNTYKSAGVLDFTVENYCIYIHRAVYIHFFSIETGRPERVAPPRFWVYTLDETRRTEAKVQPGEALQL